MSLPVYTGQAKKGAEPIQASVNETTECLAPDTAVKEIGNVFRRLLPFIDSVGTEEITMLAKIYLSDGLWRIMVEEGSKLNFAYVMPDPTGSSILLVVPSALQMGWE